MPAPPREDIIPSNTIFIKTPSPSETLSFLPPSLESRRASPFGNSSVPTPSRTASPFGNSSVPTPLRRASPFGNSSLPTPVRRRTRKRLPRCGGKKGKIGAKKRCGITKKNKRTKK